MGKKELGRRKDERGEGQVMKKSKRIQDFGIQSLDLRPFTFGNSAFSQLGWIKTTTDEAT